MCAVSHTSEAGVSGSWMELPSGDAQSLWAEREPTDSLDKAPDS